MSSRHIPTPAGSVRRFAVHSLEMLAAMVAGMITLAPCWPAVQGVEAHAVVMATTMVLGMTVWMIVRRHSLPAIAEMAVAMYLPFLIPFLPYRAGALSAEGLLTLGHLLMMPAMLLAMLLRRAEYTAPHHRPRPGDTRPEDVTTSTLTSAAAEPVSDTTT